MSVSAETIRENIRRNGALLCGRVDTAHGLWLQLKDRNVLTDWQIHACKSKSPEQECVSELLELLLRVDDDKLEDFCKALEATGQKHIVRDILKKGLTDQPARPMDAGDQGGVRQRPAVKKNDDDANQRHGPVNGGNAVPIGQNNKCYTVLGVIVIAGPLCIIVALTWGLKTTPDNTFAHNAKRPAVYSLSSSGAKSFSELFSGKRSKLLDAIAVSDALWQILKDDVDKKPVLTPRQVDDCKAQKTDADKIGRMLDILERRPPDRIQAFCDALAIDNQEHVVKTFFSDTCTT